MVSECFVDFLFCDIFIYKVVLMEKFWDGESGINVYFVGGVVDCYCGNEFVFDGGCEIEFCGGVLVYEEGSGSIIGGLVGVVGGRCVVGFESWFEFGYFFEVGVVVDIVVLGNCDGFFFIDFVVLFIDFLEVCSNRDDFLGEYVRGLGFGGGLV